MTKPKVPKNPGKGFLPVKVVEGVAPIEPYGRWKERAAKYISMTRPANLHHEMSEFLEAGEAWLEAASAEVEIVGYIGPIAMNNLATGAWQTAYSRYLWHLAAIDPKDNMRMILVASKLADAARANMNAALALTATLARSAPKQMRDPLEDYVEPRRDDVTAANDRVVDADELEVTTLDAKEKKT